MSKSKVRTKKRVVVTNTPTETKKKLAPTRSRRKTTETSASVVPKDPLLFNKQNYMLMGIGFILLIAGMLLMTGGGMDSPNEWDVDRIYGFRRTVLAPFIMLVGLGLEVYAIFKK